MRSVGTGTVKLVRGIRVLPPVKRELLADVAGACPSNQQGDIALSPRQEMAQPARLGKAPVAMVRAWADVRTPHLDPGLVVIVEPASAAALDCLGELVRPDL